MTTDKNFADKIIAGNGRINQDEAPDNPRALRIVEYTNAWGVQAYGITFNERDKNKYMLPTHYVRNPKIYWEYKQ